MALIGTIARLAAERGFGFISRSDGHDVFFHARELQAVRYDDLALAEAVSFELVNTDRGSVAVNVRRILETQEDRQQDQLRERDQENKRVDTSDNEPSSAADLVKVIVDDATRKLVEAVAKYACALSAIDWRQLERVVAEAFAGLGFDVELTPESKDGGRDVIVAYTHAGLTKSYSIEIKHWKHKRVGPQPILEFMHVIASEKQTGGVFIATGGYTKNAAESLVELHRAKVGLGTAAKVVSLCRKYMKSKQGIWSAHGPDEALVFEETSLGASTLPDDSRR